LACRHDRFSYFVVPFHEKMFNPFTATTGNRKDNDMAISMYAASAPTFVQFLTSLSANLDKTTAHAAAKKIDPAIYLRTRLYPDMHPLAMQVGLANRHAINACARLAGIAPLVLPTAEPSMDDLKQRLDQTIRYLSGFTPAQLDGTEDKEIVAKYPSGIERRFTGQAMLLSLSLPNFYFHISAAHCILRHCGIDIGKKDFNSAQHRFSGACACQPAKV